MLKTDNTPPQPPNRLQKIPSLIRVPSFVASVSLLRLDHKDKRDPGNETKAC